MTSFPEDKKKCTHTHERVFLAGSLDDFSVACLLHASCSFHQTYVNECLLRTTIRATHVITRICAIVFARTFSFLVDRIELTNRPLLLAFNVHTSI